MPTIPMDEFAPANAIGREWLVANGLGGYASSTTIGMNTRKYHGLLVARPKAGMGRFVTLSKLEETVSCHGREFPISTNSYPGAVYPHGFANQSGFSFTTHPKFTFQLGSARLEKSVRMLHGKNATVISYRICGEGDAELRIRPLLALRPIHQLCGPEADIVPAKSGFSVLRPFLLHVSSSYGKFTRAPEHYRDMDYIREKERGYASLETLQSPGFFTAKIGGNDELHILASLSPLSVPDALDILDRQEFRSPHLLETYGRINDIESGEFQKRLLHAADSFVKIGEPCKGIVAGYPWFSEWTRDSMISLPGLLLCTGKFALAREVLLEYAKRMERGMLPNFIGDDGAPDFNSSDATLWFVNAVREYLDYTKDAEFVRLRMWKHLKAFLSSHVRGNETISMDSDCLLRVHRPSSTWMDAQVGMRAVTPRNGKPVEINALWYSDLHFICDFAKNANDSQAENLAAQIISNLDSSFQDFFSANGGLFDVLSPNVPSIRPNQIFAVSLPHSPLSPLQQRNVFNIVRTHLYTPLGLRTLSFEDPDYHEYYAGNQSERDSAYHQGVIWPWLLGAFYDAQLKVRPGSEKSVLASLAPFEDAIGEGCIGTIPELYEPSTMKPCGAVSQAWSVAEVLRIYTKAKKKIAREAAEGRGRWDATRESHRESHAII